MDKFKRGDKVNFKGNKDFSACTGTFVWAILAHLGLDLYVIEHHSGAPRSEFMSKPPFPDGFESIHSSLLREGCLYIYAGEEELEFHTTQNATPIL